MFMHIVQKGNEASGQIKSAGFTSWENCSSHLIETLQKNN